MQTEKEALPPEVRPREETGTGHKNVTVVADSVLIILDRRPAMRPLCVVTAVLKESAGEGTTRRRGVAQRRVRVRGAAQRVLEAHLLALDEVVAEHGCALEQHAPLLPTKQYKGWSIKAV